MDAEKWRTLVTCLPEKPLDSLDAILSALKSFEDQPSSERQTFVEAASKVSLYEDRKKRTDKQRTKGRKNNQQNRQRAEQQNQQDSQRRQDKTAHGTAKRK